MAPKQASTQLTQHSEAPTASTHHIVALRAKAARTWTMTKVTHARTSLTNAIEIAKVKFTSLKSKREVQVAAASAVGGGALGGAGGAVVGTVSGASMGAAIGFVPALLTLGVSIPLGAVFGGAFGFTVGTVAGGTLGFVGAGGVGYGTYAKRKEIQAGVSKGRQTLAELRAKVVELAGQTNSKVTAKYISSKEFVTARLTTSKEKLDRFVAVSKQKLAEALTASKAKSIEIVKDKSVQMTAVSAGGGAAVLGAGGAVAGLATGGTMGVIAGFIAAPFTLGLSIPVGIALGSGCGLISGASVGCVAGGISGGTLGYSVYAKRETIGTAASATRQKVDNLSQTVKGTASESAAYVRAKLMGGA